jgi:3-(methylthio)propanoyl-CoA dehydrogenase
MALSEPGAGSNLAAIRTRATPDGDGWRIDGEKIFISGGDQDMSEAMLHLVLARTVSADAGTRGLSLFACLSNLPDGARNAVSVIEEKVGLHASRPASSPSTARAPSWSARRAAASRRCSR